MHRQILLRTLACSQTLSLNPHTHSCTKRFQQLQHSQSLTESAVTLGLAVIVFEIDLSPTNTVLAHWPEDEAFLDMTHKTGT